MRLCLFYTLLVSCAFAQVPASTSVELANLREDIRLLSQRVGEMALRTEQLERENAALQKKAATHSQAYASVVQLNDAIVEMNRAMKAGDAATKAEILQIVATQLEKLANQTNAALESISKGSQPVRAPLAAPSTHSTPPAADGTSKDATHYVVQKGDTLTKIVLKTGAKAQDIISANKLVEPYKLSAGQTLIIPQAK